MGLLHDMFVPVPGRFKDFIAMPKNNLYQAIHTTLISKSKNLFEVQIMTKEMRNVAQYGVLTSWRYKEDGDAAGEHEEINQYEKLHWLNELLKWQQDISNAEFLEYVKKDLDVFGKV
jgi:GTP pyrophosphokinase